MLDKYRIKYQNWGSDTTHPLSELVRRLNIEEMSLEEKDDTLILKMKVIIVHVHYNGNLGHLVLHEKGQYFYSSGRTLYRNVRGIGETVNKNESPIEAGQRALKEELGQSQPGFKNPQNYPTFLIDKTKTELNREEESRKWPGLTVRFSITHLKVTIGSELYLEQYTEDTLNKTTGQPFKMTYFGWIKAEEVSHF